MPEQIIEIDGHGNVLAPPPPVTEETRRAALWRLLERARDRADYVAQQYGPPRNGELDAEVEAVEWALHALRQHREAGA